MVLELPCGPRHQPAPSSNRPDTVLSVSGRMRREKSHLCRLLMGVFRMAQNVLGLDVRLLGLFTGGLTLGLKPPAFL